MNATTFASLLGGVGLFLLGMRMMTDGLKLAAGNALRSILQTWTRTNVRGLFAGVLITAIVQSSSAVTVATVGFVNAELLTLAQAAWVVFGANLGSTMTGWLVALVGVKVDVGALALPLIGVGMLLRLGSSSSDRRAGLGEALAGFGAFFLGVGILQSAFQSVTSAGIGEWAALLSGWTGTAAFVAIGILVTLLTQSSSATIAITLTATAGGTLPLELAAPAVIGANVGTTSTAIFASLGATAPAKRVACAHIAFNVAAATVTIALLPMLLDASKTLAGLGSPSGDPAPVLAVFHTLFNLLGVLLMWMLGARLVAFLSRRFVSAEETLGQPLYLDSTLAAVPSLALRGLILEIVRMQETAFDLARKRVAGVAAEPESRERQDGLVRLGHAVRGFIGDLAKGTLPDDVVAALPDLLRATQHLEDVAVESARLGNAPEARPRTAGSAHAAGASRDWAVLHEVVKERLDPSRLSGESAAPESETRDRALELAYEALKANLLRAGALGRLPVEAMEEELLRARRLRRLAESATKARRRLEPWVARIDGVRSAALATPPPPSPPKTQRPSAARQSAPAPGRPAEKSPADEALPGP